MDLTSLIGILLGASAVFGGAMLEGIPITSIIAPTAFIIVLGGTTGAVLLQSTGKDIMNALQGLMVIFMGVPEKPGEVAEMLVDLAMKARKEGILALQSDIGGIEDPFLKKGLELMTDGTDPHLLRELLETQLHFYEDDMGAAAKFWENAGGFAPTVGIIGAVLGLIHVMSNLNDPSKLGAGIATAFVATVYGVGAANLVFIPFGGKLKAKRKVSLMTREMMIEGILSIQAGESPNFIKEKLRVFNPDGAKDADEEAAA
ncbi:MAG: flagellar motor protein [Vampirovibrionales bacterium]|nr:flagellar motor protein [Vampirovibrionales bacterium]